jgi:hypothetical protein
MKQKPCTFLLDTAAASSPTSFSATDQLPLLSGMDMPAKFSENEQPMDGFQACECMKGMSACLIHPNTPELWTSFMRASLAKTLASLESKQAYLREPDQVFTAKSCESLAWYDQSSCSWKTYQQSFLTDSEPYSETWPRWGMTAGGSAYAHPMSERRITETDGFVWLGTPTAAMSERSPEFAKGRKPSPAEAARMVFPTPTTIDAGTGRFNTSVGSSNHRPTLAMMAKKALWPTPTAHNAKETGSPSQMERKTVQLGDLVGGSLNPMWVEWLMGFPIGFTVLKGWVTPKSRSKPQQPTACSEDFDAP